MKWSPQIGLVAVLVGVGFGSGVARAEVPGGLLISGSASQTSLSVAGYEAYRALDSNEATYSRTQNQPNSGWTLVLAEAGPVGRVEVVAPSAEPSSRLAGLVLRILDDESNTVATAVLENPGTGGTWAFQPSTPVSATSIRIGLEDGQQNGYGDRVVALAEVRVFTGRNLALEGEAFMTRHLDSLPPASNGNDDNLSTRAVSTDRAVDAYWEVDLGRTFALYGARIIEADGFAGRMGHATIRLFDEQHQSVYSQKLAGMAWPDYRVEFGQAYRARFMRVGLEQKERTHPTGDIEWWIGLKEAQVYGVETNRVGILEFAASSSDTPAGQPVTLSWHVANVDGVSLFPGVGSVDGDTGADGRGSLDVSPTLGTSYLLVATNRSDVFTREFTVTVDGVSPPPRIKEFVADNRLGIEDGFGESADWVEVFNPSAQPLDLSGYGLSDDAAEPGKWTFPSVVLPGHGRLVVFASGVNEPWDPGGDLHADFRLDADGGDVVLSAPARVGVVDQILGYPAQGEDLAYGRDPDGNLRFLEPTPGTPNSGATYDGWLPPPAFSHPRGVYESPFSLVISNGVAGSQLLVSTNGGEPVSPYAGPISIAGTQTVRARIVRDGFRLAPVQTHTYLVPDELLASPVMNTSITQDPRYAPHLRDGLFALPIFSVAMPELPDDWLERPCSLEIFWPDGQDPLQINAGLVRFGGAWTHFDKKNYRLEFRARYGAKSLEAPLFSGFDRGVTARERFDALDLRGGGHDMASRGFYMANRYVEDTMLDMGSINPHGRFVHLVINGTYWGQYNLRERLVDQFLAAYLGGDWQDYLNVRGNDNVGSSFIIGAPEPLYRASWQRVRDLRTSYEAVSPYLDVTHLTDFMLTFFYGRSETEYRAAGPQEAGSGFKFWIGDTDGFLRNTTSDTTGNRGPGDLFGSLRDEGHPDFQALVADRAFRHLTGDGAMTPARSTARLQARMQEIEDSLILECARWGVRTPANWNSAAQSVINDLFQNRPGQLLGYLRSRGLYPDFDPPVFDHPGGVVPDGFELTLQATGGTIYYTLDGTDPRLPGGGVSPNALVYQGGGSTEVMVPAGSEWFYRDTGDAPDPDWASPAYNASAWSRGPAELGYGDDDEAHTVSYGDDPLHKFITTYFRHSFEVADPADYSGLEVRLVRDDGAAVYLNGVEVVRDNLEDGVLTYETTAMNAAGGGSESQWRATAVSPALLVAGTNVVAVEVHQASETSSDISFNLSLSATVPDSNADRIFIAGETQVKTRVWDGSRWSALNEALFAVAADVPARPDNLFVTELHYNPAGESDEEQFVELYNPSPYVVDLSGVSLSNGVRFVFGPGERLEPGGCRVVVENEQAFDAVYRDPGAPFYYPGIQVAGTWSGRLSNGGETVDVLDAAGARIIRVPYDDSGDWPERADGRGSSLELGPLDALPDNPVERAAALARGTSWRSSSWYGGSPGRLDEDRLPVVVNEVLAHSDTGTDWVEIHNPGATAVDLSGLHLSDQWDLPTRYTIPEDTVLAAGGFLVLDETVLGFGLSELGSDLLMTESDGGLLTRFIDTLDLPETGRDETWGRFARCDGETDFTALLEATPGSANTLPRVGPIVITELMIRPETGLVEYIELANISSTPVSLYDPAVPSNTWVLSGAVDYVFPTGIVVAVEEVLLVCATNPAVFRAQTGVDPAVRVFGPWAGRLNNAGESLKLRRPGSPEPDGFVPHVRMDRVFYHNIDPWPVEPETGSYGLERLPVEAYGNQPCAWVLSSSAGTPGLMAGNRAPGVWVDNDLVSYQRTGLSWTVRPDDPDAPWQDVQLRLTEGPEGMILTPEGQLQWVPTGALAPGSYTVAFEVEDDGLPPLFQEVSFTLTLSSPLQMTMETLVDGTMRFGIPVFDGYGYRLQVSSNLLEDDGWEDLDTISSAVGPRWEPEMSPADSTQRVYRVLWDR